MDGMRNGGENNAALPLAGGDLRRNIPRNLRRVGIATGFTAVAGLVMALVAAVSSHSRQAEADVPLSQLPVVFLLLVILFGAVGTIFLGCLLEVEPAPTPRLREFGVAVYFVCSLLLVAGVVIVGSDDYCQLALNFIDI